MTTHKITLHADELEYTSDGLNSASHIDLKVGAHNKIVIVRPKRVRAVPVGYGTFAADSAFPTAGVLMLGMRASFEDIFSDLFGAEKTEVYQFFGHTEPSGTEAHNKKLSDRRAEMVHALFVGDVDVVRSIAKTEKWRTEQYQIMLRVLRCDPGAIDGDPGDATKAATAMFQREYVEGVFHRHLKEEPAHLPLDDDGKLNGQTLDALFDAFVAATCPRLDPARVHPTHPIVGCSEFNHALKDDSIYNRRVALVVHESLPKFHDRAPCTIGDHTVCPIDDKDARSQCLWYRAHVEDPPVEELVQRHFDLRWLQLANRKIMLSALTTLPDESDVTFQVFRTKPILDPNGIAGENLADSLSAVLAGTVRGGVAQAVWEPPDDFGLRDLDNWLVPVEISEYVLGRPSPLGKAQVPVFRIIGGEAEALSPPPGRELARIPRDPAESEEPVPMSGIDAFGRVFQYANYRDGRTESQLHPLNDAEPRMVLVRHPTKKHPQEDA